MTPTKYRILIVDDDQNFTEILRDYLRANEFQVDVAHHGVEMHAAMDKHTPDVLALDLMMPGDDGLSLVRGLRGSGFNSPILMMSASADVVDCVAALETGADDYVCKPIHLREILARIRALLRRCHAGTHSTTSMQARADGEKLYQFGPYRLNPQTHILWRGDEEIILTSAEFNLLLIFVTRPNRVLSRDTLVQLTRGYEHMPYDRSIDVLVSRLRNKLENEPTKPVYIRTIRNEGYLFSADAKIFQQ